MKKIIATISALILLVTCMTALVSCGSGKNEKIRIGYMAGPTGMGMAKLINDNSGVEGNEKYAFTQYVDTATAKADLTAGNVDVICLPTNEAAAYYNSVDDGIVVLAVNCLNSLYLVSDDNSKVTSLSDLSGKTVYTCKNGTPRLVLEYIIDKLGVDVTVSYTVGDKEMVTPADVQAQVIAGNLPYAVIPEPIVTAALAKSTKTYSVDIDLGEEWDKISDTPVTMGCIVSTSEFVKNNKRAIENFLEEYEASVEFVGDAENVETSAKYVAESGIMGAVPLAKKAILNLGDAIDYVDGDDMKEALVEFYRAIGITKLPADNFYYDD